MKTLSISELGQYYTCARAWYLHRVLRESRDVPTLPMIKGSAVHNFVAFYLHRPVKSQQRDFFYKELKSAQKAFEAFWHREMWKPEHDSAYGEDLKWWAIHTANQCVANYWTLAEGRGQPMEKEKRLSVVIPELGCRLIGVVDQVRPTNPAWADRRGIENPTVVLVDIKTGKFYSPDPDKASENEQRKSLLATSLSIQPTAYYYLYERILGVRPNAFVFWYLGGDQGKVVPTTRDDDDIEKLFDIIRDFMRRIDSSNMADFPMTPNTHVCRNCQFWQHCWPDKERPTTDVPPEALNIRPSGEFWPEPDEEPARQMRLKLRIPKNGAQ
jgi:CRISPR/Cas system-associated exonuclease Cas4 (RecB family)